ncbi:MAG: hypothetical protein WBY88_13245, partial [Desulfosarcina sp.]
MKKKQMVLDWEGTFIELCVGRISRAKKRRFDALQNETPTAVQSLWYYNSELIQSLFGASNWWSVDDLDHAMGLVFADRPALEAGLGRINFRIDGWPVSVDPEALQTSIYAPETIGPPQDDQMIVCHGTRRQAELSLMAEIQDPFDPSSITLSFLKYPEYGLILIDL